MKIQIKTVFSGKGKLGEDSACILVDGEVVAIISRDDDSVVAAMTVLNGLIHHGILDAEMTEDDR